MPVQTRSKKTAAPHMPHRNTDPITMDPIEEHRRVVANKQAYNVHSLAEIVHRAGQRDPTFGRRDAVLPHSRRVVAPEEAARWTAHARRTGWAPAVVAQMTHENRRVPDHLRGAVDAELARRQAFGHAPRGTGQRLPETILRRYGRDQKIVDFLSHQWGDLDERGRRNLERALVNRDMRSWVYCLVHLYEAAHPINEDVYSITDFMKCLRGVVEYNAHRLGPGLNMRTHMFIIDFNNLVHRFLTHGHSEYPDREYKFKTYLEPLMYDIAMMDHLSTDGVLGLVGQFARSHSVRVLESRVDTS